MKNISNIDENSPVIKQVFNRLRAFIEITGATVVVIHHPNKSKNDLASMNNISGHNSIPAGVDSALCVEKLENITTIEETKERGAKKEVLRLQFNFQALPDSVEDLEWFEFVNAGVDPTKNDKDYEYTVFKKLAINLLDGKEIGKETFKDLLKPSLVKANVKSGDNQMHSWLKRLEEDKVICVRVESNNRYISLKK